MNSLNTMSDSPVNDFPGLYASKISLFLSLSVAVRYVVSSRIDIYALALFMELHVIDRTVNRWFMWLKQVLEFHVIEPVVVVTESI